MPAEEDQVTRERYRTEYRLTMAQYERWHEVVDMSTAEWPNSS
jgi:hypothetical protein